MPENSKLKQLTDFVAYLFTPETLEREATEPRARRSFLGDLAGREALPDESPPEPPAEQRFLSWLLCFEALTEEPRAPRRQAPGFLRWLLGPERLERDAAEEARR